MFAKRLLQRTHLFCSSLYLRKFSLSAAKKMRLVQFEYKGLQKVGIETSDGGDVVNLTDADKKFPDNMIAFLGGGPELMELAKSFASQKLHIVQRNDLRILSPITGPEKVVCIGMNYKDHCLEQNAPIPTEPIIFSKFSGSIIGPGDPIRLPRISTKVDWEVELAVVIGKKGRFIKRSDAMDYVAGYTVAHDVSARDWQMERNGKQWLLGKSFDTFCPLGPALVTKDDLPDPHNLNLRCIVNLFTMQDSNTNQLIFNTEYCIEVISQFCELKPGDLILTGTPPGVGVFRKPPIFLKDGDEVTCEIDGIGKLTNPVIADEL